MSSTVSQETPAQRAAAFTASANRFAQQAQSATFDYQRRELEAKAAKYLRFASWALEAAPVEVQPVAAPVEVPAPVVEAPQAQPVRSERVQAMRAFFGAAKRAGLNTKAAEAMTAALSKYLGCIIPSRATLAPGHWAEAAAAVELGILAW